MNEKWHNDLSFAAAVFCAKTSWNRRRRTKWDSDMFFEWKRQIFEATKWNKVREPSILNSKTWVFSGQDGIF